VFLEEAAGVSKYKERRRETENRLSDTRENLTRVDDILRELNANLEKLEAQAAVANRFHQLQSDQEEKQKLLWLLRKNEAKAEQARWFLEMEQAQTGLEEQNAKMRHLELELERMRQAHYATGDRLHAAQGELYQTNSEIGSLEAQIKFVVESRTRLQNQIGTLTAQREQWLNQARDTQEQIEEAEYRLEELAARVEGAQIAVEAQNERLPELDAAWRASQERSTESRARIMQVQQRIELSSAHQRNASNILATLATRRERLQQERGSLNLPDAGHLDNLRMQLEEKQVALEEYTLLLEEAASRQESSEQERRESHAQVQQESAANARLEARLSALRQLQDRVQTQGKVQPWLQKHELDKLPRLWQKLDIEAGWETALESVLRERTGALEISNLDWARGFFGDAPPARMALYTPSGARRGAYGSPRPEAIRQPAQAERPRPARPARRLAARGLRGRRSGHGPGPARAPAGGRLLRHAARPHRQPLQRAHLRRRRRAGWRAGAPARDRQHRQAAARPGPAAGRGAHPCDPRRRRGQRPAAPPAGRPPEGRHPAARNPRAADRGGQAGRGRSTLQPAQRPDLGRPRRDRGPGVRAAPGTGRSRGAVRGARHGAGRAAGRARRWPDRIPGQGTRLERGARKAARAGTLGPGSGVRRKDPAHPHRRAAPHDRHRQPAGGASPGEHRRRQDGARSDRIRHRGRRPAGTAGAPHRAGAGAVRRPPRTRPADAAAARRRRSAHGRRAQPAAAARAHHRDAAEGAGRAPEPGAVCRSPERDRRRRSRNWRRSWSRT
jgi:uncharacterized protein YoxC